MARCVDLAYAGIFRAVLHDWLELREFVRFDTALCCHVHRAALFALMSCLPITQPYAENPDRAKKWRNICCDFFVWMEARGIRLPRGCWEISRDTWTMQRSMRESLLTKLQSVKIVWSKTIQFNVMELRSCPHLSELMLESWKQRLEDPAAKWDELLPHLRKLTLVNCELLLETIGCIGTHRSLTAIESVNCLYSPAAGPSIVTASRHFFRKVTRLHVMGSASLAVILPYFDDQSVLEDAEFGCFCMDSADVVLMEFLFQVPTVRRLKLYFCTHFIPNDMPVGRQFLPRLEALTAEASYLSASLLQLLDGCPHLRELHLRAQTLNHNTADNESMFPALYSRLRVFSTDVVGYFTAQQRHRLFHLPANRVTTMELSNWSRPHNVTEDIVSLVSRSPDLERLNISSCQCDVVQVLIAARRYCLGIKHFAVEGCGWSGDRDYPSCDVPSALESLVISGSGDERVHLSPPCIQNFFSAAGSSATVCTLAFLADWSCLFSLDACLPRMQRLIVHAVSGDLVPGRLQWQQWLRVWQGRHAQQLQSVTVFVWPHWVSPAHRDSRSYLRATLFHWRSNA